MGLLSTDYSPFGKFSIQILLIGIGLCVLGTLPMIHFGLVGLIYFILPVTFVVLGMHKQNKELFG